MGFSGCSHKNDRVFGGGGVVLKSRGRVRVTIHGKVQRLQNLIPGGEGLKEDQLMLQTAHYILRLRMQICVLQALLKLHQT